MRGWFDGFREGFKYSHKKTRKIKWIDFLVFFLKNCIVLQTFFSYDNSAKIHSQKRRLHEYYHRIIKP